MSVLITYTKFLMSQFKKDNITLLAAAQAYYYLLAIVPMLIVAFALIPYLHISPADALNFIDDTLPSEMANILRENIIEIVQTPKNGLLTIGIIGTLWSASNGVNAFIKATNEAYEVDETRKFVTVRGISLILTIGVILSLVVAILLPILSTIILDFLRSALGISSSLAIILQIGKWILSIIVITAALIVLYHYAPNKKIPFRHILPGALTACILWQLTSLGFSIYVSNFGNYSNTYGSIGGIVILMIWLFLTGLILMIGAEINAFYHKRQISK